MFKVVQNDKQIHKINVLISIQQIEFLKAKKQIKIPILHYKIEFAKRREPLKFMGKTGCVKLVQDIISIN